MKSAIIIGICSSFVSTLAFASTPDFGAIPICSTLSIMPRGFIASGDCVRPAVASCRFTLPNDRLNTRYLVEGSILVDKTYRFVRNEIGPFGIRRQDTIAQVRNKLSRLAGLRMRYWTMEKEINDENGAYLESNHMPCSRGTYSLTVWFTPLGRATGVTVSTLPVL
jgi:hypothetical protein